MNTGYQGVVGGRGINFRKVSLKSQVSSGSNQWVASPGGQGNAEASISSTKEIPRQISKQTSHNLNEGVVTESDSCVGLVSNKQLIPNSRYSAFILDESLSGLSSSANAISSPPPTRFSDQFLLTNLGTTSVFMVSSFKDKRIPLTTIVGKGGENYQKEELTGRESRQLSIDASKGEKDHKRRVVNASGMLLTKLPDGLTSRKNSLQELDLSNNCIEIFSVELCDFMQLKILKMDFNRITELPEQIAFLKHLEFLSISNNNLMRLPGTLQSISQLRVLNVSYNNIQQIGSEIANLMKLEILYISSNNFKRLPSKLRNLKRLKEFEIEWFSYVKPPIERMIIRPCHNSIFAKFFELCNQKPQINAAPLPEITFRTFVNHFSVNQQPYFRSDARDIPLIFQAVENEEFGIMNALLEDNPDLLNIIDLDGHSLLTAAILAGKQRSIEYLLELGIDARLGGGQLGSSLHLAVSKFQLNLTKKFLASGVNPNGTDFEGNTPLHLVFSLFKRDPETAKEIAEELLANGADPNALSKEFWAPLHQAVRKNQREAVSFAMVYNQREHAAFREGDGDNADELFDEDDNDDEDNASNKSEEQLVSQVNTRLTTEASRLNGGNNANNNQNDMKNQKDEEESRREEDLSEEMEYKSPLLTGQTSRSGSHLNPKISKQPSKRLFNFDREGGPSGWSPMHLAASQGNIQMLEILSEANACPFSLTKFDQTPRKVALQSLILFKVLRKYEDRWTRETLLHKSDNFSHSPKQGTNGVGIEKNIQNLRGFIAETMKCKEHFLNSQLDLFDDKEFGYSIKDNFLNNQAQKPSNTAVEGAQEDDDDIADPELSVGRQVQNFRFSPCSAEGLSLQNESSLQGSGTLKPQQFGNGLGKSSKSEGFGLFANQVKNTENEDQDIGNETELDENDLLESTNENHFCANNVNKTTVAKLAGSNLGERNCGIIPLSNESVSFPDSRFLCVPSHNAASCASKNSQHVSEHDIAPVSVSFSDLKLLELSELDRLGEKITNFQTVFTESLSGMLLLRFLHIRLSKKSMRFTSEKGTLPRNIHILNEFLLSRISTFQETLHWREQIIKVLTQVQNALFSQIRPLPQPESNLTYISLQRASKIQRNNIALSLLLLNVRDALFNLNSRHFFQEFLENCKNSSYFKNPNLAFSSADYSDSLLLHYENTHSFQALNSLPVPPDPPSYIIVGSPSFTLSQIKQQSKQSTSTQQKHHQQSKTQNNRSNAHSNPLKLDPHFPEAHLSAVPSKVPQKNSKSSSANISPSSQIHQSAIPVHQTKIQASFSMDNSPITQITQVGSFNKSIGMQNNLNSKNNSQFCNQQQSKKQSQALNNGEENIDEEEDLCFRSSMMEANKSCIDRMALKQFACFSQQL